MRLVATSSSQLAELNWPTRPLRLVVGFGGGSSPDFVARALAVPMAKALGQPVGVENHPGASGNIAADIVAKSTDRHTVGILINGNMTIGKVLNPATPYDPQRDLVPLSIICTAPEAMARPASARSATSAWNFSRPAPGSHPSTCPTRAIHR